MGSHVTFLVQRDKECVMDACLQRWYAWHMAGVQALQNSVVHAEVACAAAGCLSSLLVMPFTALQELSAPRSRDIDGPIHANRFTDSHESPEGS